MMKFFTCILSVLLLSLAVKANNVRVNGKVVPVINPEGLIQLNFSVSWDNAWNDPYNWDAVWAFVKYRKKNDAGAWKHGYLAASGHTATGLNISLGDNGDLVVGAFLFPQANGAGPVNDKGVALVLAQEVLDGVTKEEVLGNEVDFSLQLIEMVLVPEAPFYAGDGVSTGTLGSPADLARPLLIGSEENIMVGVSGEGVSLSDHYPKGFGAFYAMKYELSQAQYVDFLNKLSRQQQQVSGRVPDLASLKSGDYIFGDKSKPSARNGIVVHINESDRPAIFAHNLTQDDRFNADDDGQTLACNFISPWEMMNYCHWAGLRPMSELEYEKACRKPYPELPLPGEYAWNSTVCSAVASGDELEQAYSEKESVTDVNKNVNSGNHIGPLRCGVFASHTSPVTREKAGATCCGMLEMSGNLREICYTVEASDYKYNSKIGDYLGNGELNPSGSTTVSDIFWPKMPEYFVLKGGGFSSPEQELRVSDRSRVGYIKDARVQDSTLGCRAVRNAPDPASYVDPGKVVGANGRLKDTLCSSPDVRTYQLQNVYLPSFIGNVSGVNFNYQWYVKKGTAVWDTLKGENNPALNYQDAFVNTTDETMVYQFRREISFPGGTINSPIVELCILNGDVLASAYTDKVDACGIAAGITLTAKTESQFVWSVGDKELLRTVGTTSLYKAKRADFAGQPDAFLYTVVCEVSAGSCVVSKQFLIEVDSATADPADCPCGTPIVDANGHEYPTVEINGKCWMAKNLNTGQRWTLAGLDTIYKMAGIQKGCFGDASQNCRMYGALYPWWEVLCDGQCSENFNKSSLLWQGLGGKIPEPVQGGANLELKSYGVKLSDNGKFIQGICPKGWHLPSDGEWKNLEEFIGMSSSAIGSDDAWSRPTDPVGNARVLMKSYGYGENVWCLGEDCDKTGFSAYFGGYIEKSMKSGVATVTPDVSKNVRWWTATAGGKSSQLSIVRGISVDEAVTKMTSSMLPAMGRHRVGRHSAVYVRCMKDY